MNNVSNPLQQILFDIIGDCSCKRKTVRASWEEKYGSDFLHRACGVTCLMISSTLMLSSPCSWTTRRHSAFNESRQPDLINWSLKIALNLDFDINYFNDSMKIWLVSPLELTSLLLLSLPIVGWWWQNLYHCIIKKNKMSILDCNRNNYVLTRSFCLIF